jgi:hypothetical protein
MVKPNPTDDAAVRTGKSKAADKRKRRRDIGNDDLNTNTSAVAVAVAAVAADTGTSISTGSSANKRARNNPSTIQGQLPSSSTQSKGHVKGRKHDTTTTSDVIVSHDIKKDQQFHSQSNSLPIDTYSDNDSEDGKWIV